MFWLLLSSAGIKGQPQWFLQGCWVLSKGTHRWVMRRDGWREEMLSRRDQKCSSSDNWGVSLALGGSTTSSGKGSVTDLFVCAFSLRMKGHFWTLKGQEGGMALIPSQERQIQHKATVCNIKEL